MGRSSEHTSSLTTNHKWHHQPHSPVLYCERWLPPTHTFNIFFIFFTYHRHVTHISGNWPLDIKIVGEGELPPPTLTWHQTTLVFRHRRTCLHVCVCVCVPSFHIPVMEPSVGRCTSPSSKQLLSQWQPSSCNQAPPACPSLLCSRGVTTVQAAAVFMTHSNPGTAGSLWQMNLNCLSNRRVISVSSYFLFLMLVHTVRGQFNYRGGWSPSWCPGRGTPTHSRLTC